MWVTRPTPAGSVTRVGAGPPACRRDRGGRSAAAPRPERAVVEHRRRVPRVAVDEHRAAAAGGERHRRRQGARVRLVAAEAAARVETPKDEAVGGEAERVAVGARRRDGPLAAQRLDAPRPLARAAVRLAVAEPPAVVVAERPQAAVDAGGDVHPAGPCRTRRGAPAPAARAPGAAAPRTAPAASRGRPRRTALGIAAPRRARRSCGSPTTPRGRRRWAAAGRACAACGASRP